MTREHWSHLYPEKVARGASHPSAKLTKTQIEEICTSYRTNRPRQTWLARKHGVCRMTIWRHLKAAGLK